MRRHKHTVLILRQVAAPAPLRRGDVERPVSALGFADSRRDNTMTKTIHLSNGTSYEGVLCVRNERWHSEGYGFRLWWLNPDTDCMVPDCGLCDTAGVFRREYLAVAYGDRNYGVKAKRIS